MFPSNSCRQHGHGFLWNTISMKRCKTNSEVPSVTFGWSVLSPFGRCPSLEGATHVVLIHYPTDSQLRWIIVPQQSGATSAWTTSDRTTTWSFRVRIHVYLYTWQCRWWGFRVPASIGENFEAPYMAFCTPMHSPVAVSAQPMPTCTVLAFLWGEEEALCLREPWCFSVFKRWHSLLRSLRWQGLSLYNWPKL